MKRPFFPVNECRAETLRDSRRYDYGGPSLSLAENPFPRPVLTEIIPFTWRRLYKDKFFLQQKYVAEGLSVTQIAQETFSSKATIRSALVRFGLKRDAKNRHRSRPAQVPYGYRILNGSMVPHLGEQRVIHTIRELRNQGLTLRAIAKVLDQMKVPTKCRGKRWRPEMVNRALSSPIFRP